jgi:hypothetical protein
MQARQGAAIKTMTGSECKPDRAQPVKKGEGTGPSPVGESLEMEVDKSPLLEKQPMCQS